MDEPDRQALATARAAFVAALSRGDAQAASVAYAEDASLLAPSTGPIRGRASIEAFWRAGLDAGMAVVELQPLEVDGDGRLAYELGRYALRLEPPAGETVVDRGAYLLVHALQPDGAWRRTVEVLSPEAPCRRTSPAATSPGSRCGPA